MHNGYKRETLIQCHSFKLNDQVSLLIPKDSAQNSEQTDHWVWLADSNCVTTNHSKKCWRHRGTCQYQSSTFWIMVSVCEFPEVLVSVLNVLELIPWLSQFRHFTTDSMNPCYLVLWTWFWIHHVTLNIPINKAHFSERFDTR